MAFPEQVAVILHKPRSLDNVGAVARVVKNFALGRLWLVDPLSYSFERAHKLAVGAEDIVAGLFVERDLPTALSSFALTIGTSSRRLRDRLSLSPAAAAARLATAAGPCALVFGDEKNGLSDDELALCQEACAIPTEAAQPSLNLAQACAIMAYALVAGQPVRSPPAEPRPAAAAVDQAELWRLQARLRELLEGCDFLNRQAPEHILRELLRPLERAQLTAREAELWSNALRKAAGALTGRRPTP